VICFVIYLIARIAKITKQTGNGQRARYREIHAISLEEHNDLLANQGWDEGEFEASASWPRER